MTQADHNAGRGSSGGTNRELLTTADVARMLGGNTTDDWVRKQCNAGEIPAFKIGTRWRIEPEEFDRWLK